jgi:hypothetical protein
MMRVAMTVAIAVIAFSTMVAAVAAVMKPAKAQGLTAAPTPHEIAVNWEWSVEWPEPKAPFDETPITPVESAGAPMFP